MPPLLALLLVLGLLLTACDTEADLPDDAAPEPAGADQPEAAADDPGDLTAVATVFPLAWMAERIAPDATVQLLGAGGQDPHDVELSPGAREAIETADVVLYMGDLDFQPQVELAVELTMGRVIDASGIAGRDALIEADHVHDDHGHDDDHDHGDDQDHAHIAYDPHLWFDAQVMIEVAGRIGETFATVDPDNTTVYTDNAAEVAEELREVNAEADERLAACAHDTVIVSHEAYAYLLEPRGLSQEGIAGPGGHGEASPQRLAELTERIEEEDIPAVAAEPVEGRADAEALAAESGAELIEIHPLEAVEPEDYETGYVDLLREQIAAFATALECG